LNKPARNLERIYRTYNKKFFDGTLPADTRVWWVRIKEADEKCCVHGVTLGLEDNETKHLSFEIFINPDTHVDKSQLRMTLLHEMAHVKLYPYLGHGKRFEEEMTRLALRGAMKGLW
jgi:hypothetical protein